MLRGGLFVTGTDTGIGKTVTCAAIAASLSQRGLRVSGFKPVQTGWSDAVMSDIAFVQAVGGGFGPLDLVCPYRLHLPLAPAVAARLERREINVGKIEAAYARLLESSDLVLVEGAGGLLVPLIDELSMAGLAARLGVPILVVSRPGLGAINHTLLTVEAARRRGLQVAGIVISGFPAEPAVAEATNPAEILRLADVALLGVLPFDGGIDVDRGRHGELVSWATDALAPCLGGTFESGQFLSRLSAIQPIQAGGSGIHE